MFFIHKQLLLFIAHWYITFRILPLQGQLQTFVCVSVSIQRIISKHYWIKKALKKSHLLCMGGKKRSIVTAYTSFSTWKLGSQYCNCKGVCAVHIVIIWLNRGELSTKEYLGTPGRVSVLNLPQWLKILQHIQQIKKKNHVAFRDLYNLKS